MSEEKFYRCIPELNKECKKSNCFINGGECENTIHKEYALKGLLEEIERLTNQNKALNEMYELTKKEYIRLNNIINGMEKFFQYAYDNEVRPLNDRKVSVWTICLDKLQELKGEDKE